MTEECLGILSLRHDTTEIEESVFHECKQWDQMVKIIKKSLS